MPTEAFVVRLVHRPQQREAVELLEVILAGASLMLDLDVLFEGQAVSFLVEEQASPWRQLLDHGLARLWYHGDQVDAGRLVLAASPLDDQARNRLFANRTVIEL